MSHFGNEGSPFSGDAAQVGLTFWMVIMAIIAFVQLVLGLIVLLVQIKDSEPIPAFSVVNTLMGLVLCRCFVITP
ncbi:hypothetical protein EDF62_0047 [Leucobacter luti]|uniref:Uncharacterized protein n=1 Tax=Leucobacter luti TaxID=340320 RepID=A0A4R6S8Z8_9MICO|nr:hypothetical protein [Leucobacter luti]TDP95366.1 hypothetical protein EDF62_0047 [Leucobacter luti]